MIKARYPIILHCKRDDAVHPDPLESDILIYNFCNLKWSITSQIKVI